MTLLDSMTGRGMEALSLLYAMRSYRRSRTPAASFMHGQRSAFYHLVWKNAADAVGATVLELDDSVMEIRHARLRLLVCDNVTSLDDPVTLAIAGDKPLVHRLLAERHIAGPRYAVCRRDDLRAARASVAALGGRCVIKPAHSGSAGAGITTGVTEADHLAPILAKAGARSRDVMVEEQIEGDNYRLLYLDGEFIDAVLRRPPTIRGDGHSTIRQLVRAENEDRTKNGAQAAQSLLDVDADVRHTLRAQGYDLSSVPAAGVAVQVKRVVNDNRREENEGGSSLLCAAIVEEGSAAARALGVRVAGVDVITTDPAVPLRESGGAVLEVNTTPGFYYHYMRNDEGTSVALSILSRLVGE
jgi:cyanophycin synthetase